jgi:hypothetical protein
MGVEEFDRLMFLAAGKRDQARHLVMEATEMELRANAAAGVYHTNRDPGFPCWRVRGVEMPYCGTPREALVTANRIRSQREAKQHGQGGAATQQARPGADAG